MNVMGFKCFGFNVLQLKKQSIKIITLVLFFMQYVIITFRQVIFIDASTSGFKSELIIRSLWHAFVAFFKMLFLKLLMQTVLTRCKIMFWYCFMQNASGKLLMCDCFALLPLKIILTSFVKGVSKKFALNQVNFVIFRIENMKGRFLPT